MRRTRFMLLVGAALPLAACGADDVASPGDGVIVVPTPTPTTPTPTTPTPTTPTPGTPAADCPSGTTDAGVVGTYRACRLPSQILTDLSLPRRAGTAYQINGRVDVGVDVGGAATPLATGRSAILTIEAGVILFGNGGDADNDFLVVNRGSRIQAEGTVTRPIVFTARENILGTATDTSQGLWGGVILAGRAPISNCRNPVPGGSALCDAIVEGTGNAIYGGEIANDSSGVFKYVQIRYSGIAISQGNELQGLTTAGVGSGTTIEYVQVHNSADDGIEVFGGRHNARYLVMTGTDDDGLDTDVGHQGAFQFVLAVQRTGNGSSDPRGFEIDSDANPDALPRNDFRISNFTIVQALNQVGILLRGGTDARLANGIVVNPLSTCLDIDAPETIRATDTTGTPAAPVRGPLQDNGPPTFNSIFFQCTAPFTDDTNVTAAEIATVFGATGNTNNTTAGTGGVTNIFFPAGAAASTPAFNATALNFAGSAFLVATTYIGAFSGPNDTWARGWTCDSATANFGSSSACTALPAFQ